MATHVVIMFLLVLCPLLPTEAACMGHLGLKVPKELPEGLPALDSFVFLLSVQSGQQGAHTLWESRGSGHERWLRLSWRI